VTLEFIAFVRTFSKCTSCISIRNDYYLHLVSCHCNLGLVHFKLLKHSHIVLSLRKKNYWYFETKSLHNHSHQRPSVKLKIHQNKSRLGLCPRPHWGSLQCSPRPPSWIIIYQPFAPSYLVITLFGFQTSACMRVYFVYIIQQEAHCC